MRGTYKKLGLLVVMMLALVAQTFAQTVVPTTKEEEKKQIAIIKSDAGVKEKSDACRFLSIIGTKDAVPALVALLDDEKLGHKARLALETIPDSSADKALLKAMGELKGMRLVGVIGSYGVRGKSEGSDTVIKCMSDPDPQVAQAAARALGKVGHKSFIKPMLEALKKASKRNSAHIIEGLFRVAEKQAAEGNKEDALKIYGTLLHEKNAPHQIRAGAIRGGILNCGDKQIGSLNHFLKSEDYIHFSAAVQTTREIEGEAVTKALTDALDGQSAPNQALIALTLGNRGDKTATSAMIKLAQKGDVIARVPAIRSLPQIGDETAIPALIKLLDDSEGEVVEAAKKAIVSMPGWKANVALRKMVQLEDPAKKVLAINLISQRRSKRATPLLLKEATSENADVRKAALTTVGELGGRQQIKPLLDLLTRKGGEADMETATRALIAVCSRLEKPESATAPVVAKMADATAAQKNNLMRLLGTIGGTNALNAVKKATKDADADTQMNAIRTLANWKSTDAAPALAQLAKSSKQMTQKVTALRGYIKMIRADGLSNEQRLDMAKKAAGLAERVEEKKMLIGTLSNVPTPQTLAMVMESFDVPETSDEAAIAAITICEKIGKGNKAAATAALTKIKEGTKNKDLAKRANDTLNKVK